MEERTHFLSANPLWVLPLFHGSVSDFIMKMKLQVQMIRKWVLGLYVIIYMVNIFISCFGCK